MMINNFKKLIDNSLKNSLLSRILFSNLTKTKFNKHGLSHSTVDEREISKFHSSDQWWNGEEFIGLRLMNELRIDLIKKGFESVTKQNTSRPLSGIKLLDIGCGGGLLSEPLARLGACVTGIDPLDNNITIAHNHSQLDNSLKDNLIYKNTTIEEFSSVPDNQQAFDCVIASEVVEHVRDIDMFVKCSVECLRPQGKFFITTINQNIISYFGAIFIAEYILNILPKGIHTYDKFISPSALQLLLEENGCNVTLIHGMCYNPLTQHWSWTQNTSINYAIEAVKN